MAGEGEGKKVAAELVRGGAMGEAGAASATVHGEVESGAPANPEMAEVARAVEENLEADLEAAG